MRTSFLPRLLLTLNLLFVVANAGVVGLVGFIGLGFSGSKSDVAWIVGALLFAVIITWLTIRCLRSPDRRTAFAIFVLSIPVYAFYGSSWTASISERRLARTFINGDAAASAEARARLESARRSFPRPAEPILVAALKTDLDPARRLAAVQLLGAIGSRDTSVATALVRFARRDSVGGAPTPLRAAAFAALRNANPYAVDVINVHYAGLTPQGLATFRLPANNPLYGGDVVSVAVAGLVLPRADSPNACEAAMARKADSLIADTLARAKRIDLAEVRLLSDGEYVAGVNRDGWYLHNLLQKELPTIDVASVAVRDSAVTTDWCRWLPRAANNSGTLGRRQH